MKVKDMFKKKTIYYRDLIPIAETRWVWWNKNFSGIKGWKEGMTEELNQIARDRDGEDEINAMKPIFKLFERVVFLDSSRKEFWKLPNISISKKYACVGWMYWSLTLMFETMYFVNPDTYEGCELLHEPQVLEQALAQSMYERDEKAVKNIMDIMLKLNYEKFKISSKLISKTGDRIIYTVTYPQNTCQIDSVNGISNQVLAAKYKEILTTIGSKDKDKELLHKDKMTPKQLAWMNEW